MGLDGNKQARERLNGLCKRFGVPPFLEEVQPYHADSGSMPRASIDCVKSQIGRMPYIRMDDITSSVHTLPRGGIVNGASAMIESLCAESRSHTDAQRPLFALLVSDLSSDAPMHRDANLIKSATNQKRRYTRELTKMQTENKFPHHAEKTSRFRDLMERSQDAAEAELDMLYKDPNIREYLILCYKPWILRLFNRALCNTIALRDASGCLSNVAVIVRDQDNNIIYSKRALELEISLGLPRDLVLEVDGASHAGVDMVPVSIGERDSGLSVTVPVSTGKPDPKDITSLVEADCQIPMWTMQLFVQLGVRGIDAGSEYAIIYVNNDMDSIILTSNWLMWMFERCYLVFGSPPVKPSLPSDVIRTDSSVLFRQVFSVNNYRALLHAMDYPADDIIGVNGAEAQMRSTNSREAVRAAMERHVALCAVWLGGGSDFLKWPANVSGDTKLPVITELAVAGPNFYRRIIIDAAFQSPPDTSDGDDDKPAQKGKRASSREQRETNRLTEIYASMKMRSPKATHEELRDQLTKKYASSEAMPGIDVDSALELTNESFFRAILPYIGVLGFVPSASAKEETVAGKSFRENFDWIIKGTNAVLSYMRLDDMLHGAAAPQRLYLEAGVPREPDEEFSTAKMLEAFESWHNTHLVRTARAIDYKVKTAEAVPAVVVGRYTERSAQRDPESSVARGLAPHPRTMKQALSGPMSKYC